MVYLLNTADFARVTARVGGGGASKAGWHHDWLDYKLHCVILKDDEKHVQLTNVSYYKSTFQLEFNLKIKSSSFKVNWWDCG